LTSAIFSREFQGKIGKLYSVVPQVVPKVFILVKTLLKLIIIILLIIRYFIIITILFRKIVIEGSSPPSTAESLKPLVERLFCFWENSQPSIKREKGSNLLTDRMRFGFAFWGTFAAAWVKRN